MPDARCLDSRKRPIGWLSGQASIHRSKAQKGPASDLLQNLSLYYQIYKPFVRILHIYLLKPFTVRHI